MTYGHTSSSLLFPDHGRTGKEREIPSTLTGWSALTDRLLIRLLHIVNHF